MLDSGDRRVVRYRRRHVQLARASARYDAVNVQMEREQLAPGMEYREKAERAPIRCAPISSSVCATARNTRS
jgi:hypothetical protein